MIRRDRTSKGQTVFVVAADITVTKAKVCGIDRRGYVHFLAPSQKYSDGGANSTDGRKVPHQPVHMSQCFKTLRGAVLYLVVELKKQRKSTNDHIQRLKALLRSKKLEQILST